MIHLEAVLHGPVIAIPKLDGTGRSLDAAFKARREVYFGGTAVHDDSYAGGLRPCCRRVVAHKRPLQDGDGAGQHALHGPLREALGRMRRFWAMRSWSSA